MTRFTNIVLVLLLSSSTTWALSYYRTPHSDPVFEAIHQGNRETVLEHLENGYDPNAEVIIT